MESERKCAFLAYREFSLYRGRRTLLLLLDVACAASAGPYQEYIVPLKSMEYGDPIMIYPEPCSIYLRGTIDK